MQIKLILLTAYFAVISGLFNGTTIRMGTIMEPLGALQVIRGKLEIDVDLSPPVQLTDALQRYEMEILKIQAEIHNHMTEKFSGKREPAMVVTHIKKRIDLKAGITLRALRHVMQTNWLSTVNRRKRGLIDAGGEFLRGLFGTATEGQIKEIKRKVEVFEVEAEMMKKGYQGILRNINSNHEMIVQMTSNLNGLMQDVRKAVHSFN